MGWREVGDWAQFGSVLEALAQVPYRRSIQLRRHAHRTRWAACVLGVMARLLRAGSGTAQRLRPAPELLHLLGIWLR